MSIFDQIEPEPQRAKAPVMDIWDQAAQESTRSNLTRSAILSHNTDPDKLAANIKAVKAQGIPWPFALPAEHPPSVSELTSTIKDFQGLNGKTAQAMTNPDFAKLAKDDHKNLTAFEWIMDRFRGMGQRLLSYPETAYEMGKGLIEAPIRAPLEFGATAGLMAPKWIGGQGLPFQEARKAAGEMYKTYIGNWAFPDVGQENKYTQANLEAIGQILGLPKSIATWTDEQMARAWPKYGEMIHYVPKGNWGKFLQAVTQEGMDWASAIMMFRAGGEMRGKALPEGHAETFAKNMQDTIKTAKESKLRQRDPDLYRDFVDSTTQDAPPVQMPIEKVKDLLAEKDLKADDVLSDPTDYYEKVFDADFGARMEGEPQGEPPKVDLPISDLTGDLADHITDEHIKDMAFEGEKSENEMEAEKAAPQEKTYIHETNAPAFDKFDISKMGSGQGDAWLGRGIYLQEKGGFKLETYGKNKIEATLKPDANIFEIKDTPKGKWRDNFIEWYAKNHPELEEGLEKWQNPKNILPRDLLRNKTENDEIIKEIRKEGYDGLLQDGELVVYNPEVLKISKPQEAPGSTISQEGAETRPQAKTRKPFQAKTLLSWVRAQGGIWDESLKGETRQFGGKESGVRGLISKGSGKAFDELASLAKDYGWIGEDATAKDFIDLLSKDVAAAKQGKERVKSLTQDIEKGVLKEIDRGDMEMGEWADELTKEGWKVYGTGNEETVGDIAPGDRILINGEEYSHIGFDKDGKAILKDGETLRLDAFDKIPVEAIKEKDVPRGTEETTDDTILLHAGINPMDGVRGAMRLAGDIRDSKVGQKVETLMTPGLETGKGIKQGVQSLVLPTAKSPEHLRAAELLGSKLGKMHRNQESAAASLKKDITTFEKMGVHNDKIPLTENPGVKFMSDMSQGRAMDPKLKAIADKIAALFQDRIAQLEAAGAPLETVRDNYFPGMWTRESREAFNLAVGGYIERLKALGQTDDIPLKDWSPEVKALIKDRVAVLMKGGKGSKRDGLQYLTRTPFKGRESFRKGKIFDDIMSGVDFGLEPISTNPIDLVQLKLAEMDRSIMANDALKDWRKSGDEKFLRIGQRVPEGWVKVNDKYGTVYGPKDMAGEGVYIGRPIVGHRIVKEPVADVLNNYLSSSLYNNKYFGSLYRGYMGAANILNQTQLGVGSAFHAGFTEAEVTISSGANMIKDIYGVLNGTRSIGQLIKSAARVPMAWIKNPIEGDTILKEWRNPGSSMDPKIQQIVKAAELAGMGFRLEKGLRTEQTAKMIQDWYSDRKIKAVARSPIASIELMAKPIMDYLVPRQKAGVFGHLIERIIEQNPGKSLEALTPEFRQAGNRIDARLGQVNYDRLFMNNAAKNAVQGLVRAPGWTGGTIAEIGGAFKDAGKFLKEWATTGKAPKELPDRVAYTLALVGMMTAVNGLLTYAFTGDKPNGTDYWAFRTGGTDEYGRPERFVLPTYMKDIFAYTEDPGKTLLAKTHPIISIMADLIKNKDYYGVTISNEDDGQILKAIECGEYVLKQFTPFWIRGMQKESERGGGFMETLQTQPQKLLAPQIGIMPAPSAYTLSPASKLLNKFIGQQIPEGGRTQEEADKSKARREIIKKLRSDKPLSDKEQEVFDSMTDRQRKSIEADAELTPIQANFKRLQDPTLEKSIKVWAKASDEERDQIREFYEARIDKYMASHNLDDDQLEKLNERIDRAEMRQ